MYTFLNDGTGNEYFKQQKYPEAIKHYTESLRRNPNDPKVNEGGKIHFYVLVHNRFRRS